MTQITQRITINQASGKTTTPRVFERTMDLQLKPGMTFEYADCDPLELIKYHAFGSTHYVFRLDRFEGRVAIYRPETYRKGTSLLQNIHHWGFQEVQP